MNFRRKFIFPKTQKPNPYKDFLRSKKSIKYGKFVSNEFSYIDSVFCEDLKELFSLKIILIWIGFLVLKERIKIKILIYMDLVFVNL